MTESPYRVIKRSIEQGIASGQWRIGQILPSEHALCRSFSVSRMTVNRAMRELANENVIRRVPGVGSFVAEPAAQSALVEIRNIAAEIQSRHHHHAAQVLALESVAATAEIAEAFGLKPAEPVFHSKILHFEDRLPLQIEDRFVNPAVAPLYLQQDFSLSTPSEYLTRVAPLQEGEHVVQAATCMPDISYLLRLEADEPCLLVTRRTWSANRLASLARLYHPGHRFRLQGRFKPS